MTGIMVAHCETMAEVCTLCAMNKLLSLCPPTFVQFKQLNSTQEAACLPCAVVEFLDQMSGRNKQKKKHQDMDNQ